MAWQDIATSQLGGQAPAVINYLSGIDPNRDWSSAITQAAGQLNASFPDRGWMDPGRGAVASIASQIVSNAGPAPGSPTQSWQSSIDALNQQGLNQAANIQRQQNPPDKGLFGGGLGTILGLGGLALGGAGALGLLGDVGAAAGGAADLGMSFPGLTGMGTLGVGADLGGAAAGGISLADLASGASGISNLGQMIPGTSYGAPTGSSVAGGSMTNASNASNFSWSDPSTWFNSVTPGSLVGPAANLAGSLFGANAATGAAQTQANAANQATQAQLGMFNQTQQNLAPYMGQGASALPAMGNFLGLPGYQNAPGVGGLPYGAGTTPFSLAQFQASPAYNFNLQQGQSAIDKASAARGNFYAPQTLQDISRFSQGLASNEFQNAFQNYNTSLGNIYNRLSGITGAGQNAATGLGGFAQNVGGQIGQNITGAGNALAAGQVGQANALTGGLSGAYNAYLTNQILGQSQSDPFANVNWNAGNAPPLPVAQGIDPNLMAG